MASASASVVQKLETRAITAERMIASLLQEIFSKVNNFLIQKLKIADIKGYCTTTGDNDQAKKLEAENKKLAQEIELCKKKLIELEIKNGKKQIPLPTAKPQEIAVAEKAPAPVAEPKKQKSLDKPPGAPAPEAGGKAAKKEKPKKPQAPKQPEKADDDVTRLDLRVGLITKAERHPDADSLYLETIDVGSDAPLTVVSGLAGKVPLEEMQNRPVILLCNLKPAKMRGIVSQAMVMCASEPGGKVEVLAPPAGAVPGDRVALEGEEVGQPDTQLKSKVWEAVAAKLRTRPDLVAGFDGKKLIVPGKGEITTKSLAGVPIK